MFIVVRNLSCFVECSVPSIRGLVTERQSHCTSPIAVESVTVWSYNKLRNSSHRVRCAIGKTWCFMGGVKTFPVSVDLWWLHFWGKMGASPATVYMWRWCWVLGNFGAGLFVNCFLFSMGCLGCLLPPASSAHDGSTDENRAPTKVGWTEYVWSKFGTCFCNTTNSNVIMLRYRCVSVEYIIIICTCARGRNAWVLFYLLFTVIHAHRSDGSTLWKQRVTHVTNCCLPW